MTTKELKEELKSFKNGTKYYQNEFEKQIEKNNQFKTKVKSILWQEYYHFFNIKEEKEEAKIIMDEIEKIIGKIEELESEEQ